MTAELEPFCFWCGGNARYDFFAEPRGFYANTQAMCRACEALGCGGIYLFELTETNPGCGNPVHVSGRAFYTGRWTVIDDRSAKNLFGPHMVEGVLKTRIAGLRDDNYARAGFDKYPWRTIQ